MILRWHKSDFRAFEKILATVFDGGIMLRSQMATVLDWKASTLHSYIKDMIKGGNEDYLVKFHPSTLATGGERTAYALSQKGAEYTYEMLGIEFSKVYTPESQMLHYIGTNEILVRLVKSLGFDGAIWQSTREASDELFAMRRRNGESEATVKSTQIRPDALYSKNGILRWMEYDNSTEGIGQITKKYRLYMTNLSDLDSRYQHVVWVVRTEARRVYLERAWKEMDSQKVEMSFFVAGNEVSVWGAEPVPSENRLDIKRKRREAKKASSDIKRSVGDISSPDSEENDDDFGISLED